jgi:hypothetical protein
MQNAERHPYLKPAVNVFWQWKEQEIEFTIICNLSSG